MPAHQLQQELNVVADGPKVLCLTTFVSRAARRAAAEVSATRGPSAS